MARDGTPAPRDRPSSWPSRLTWPRRPAHPVLAAAIGAGLAAYAWVAGSAAPFSRGAFLAVLIPAAVLALIAYGRPPERIPPPEHLDILGTSYWLIVLTAFFEWEASAYKDNSWPWHPSFTDLINPLMGPHVVKSAAILAWMLAGWALVRR
jgi:hypothetical protein